VRPDPVGPVVLNLAGIAMLVAAWIGASGQTTLGPQIVFVNLGVAGVILALAGNLLYLFNARRIVLARRAVVSAHRRVRGA
jgi:hypothetical protein